MNEPKMVTGIPGPKSLKIWRKEEKHMTTGLAPCTLYTPIVFERGKGAILWDVDGNSYIDFAAGVLTNSTGHCHPKLVKRLEAQVEKLWHIHDFPCPDRYKLCELLSKKAPGDIDTFEFYSGGAETVEAAMRAATSYNKGKFEFLGFHGGYHGKTLGSRAIWGCRTFGPIPSCLHVPYPYCYRCEFGLKYPECDLQCAKYAGNVIKQNKDVLAAVVFEPILGAGGIVIPPREYWKIIVDTCRQNGVLVIADEILVGIGRTGQFFASEYYGIEPDLICSGKGLGSGFPVMALGGKREIMTSKPYGAAGGASTSFGGNPLAIAVALATIEVIDEENILENVRKVGDFVTKRLNEIKEKHPLIGDIRGMGLLHGIELVKDRKTKEPADEEGKQVYLEGIRHGLKFLTTDRLTRFSPPLNISLELVKKALDIYEEAVGLIEGKCGYL
jgi:4-aminobutyrate aminotransferase/(S)-3-amino-2-methylpropionate transaminase